MTTIAIMYKNSLRNRLTAMLRNCMKGIKELFSLEEVEVTFTKVGDSTRYSYTKVNHRHAA